MEDPEEDWGVDEHYPCSSGNDESESKVSWIWNRGLNLGKKVVITGFAISSAPIVLPPLVFVSALGVAVSVPFGVMYASYYCTEKLMSKLLPMPVTPPSWEYENLPAGKESESGGETVMEREVKEETEDGEIRIELVEEDENREQQEGRWRGESLKDKGYEEDVGEYLQGEDEEGSLGGLDVKTEGSMEEVDRKTQTEESKKENLLPEVKRVVAVHNEEKKIDNATSNTGRKEESTDLQEKVRDEGHAGESVKKNKKKNKHHHSKKHHGEEGKEEEIHGKMNEESGRKARDEDAIAKKVVAESDDRSSIKPVGTQGTAINGNTNVNMLVDSKTAVSQPKGGVVSKSDAAISSNK